MQRTVALTLLASGLALAATWTPEFSMRFQTVGQASPSPDGKWIVYTQTRNVVEPEKSETLTHVFLAAADGSRRVQLTRGDKSCNAPAFSPDGAFVYFASDRTAAKRNVFRIPVRAGEAEQVTEFKGNIGQFAVSPDGKWIAFTGHEPPADLEKSKKEKRDMRVVGAALPNQSLYLVPAEPDADGKRPQKKLVDAAYHITAIDWSPDSRTIAFSHQPTAIADDWPKADIAEVDVATANVRPIAATPAAESQPFYSPDGRFIAYKRSSVPARWAADDRIAIVPRQGGEARTLPATQDEQPNLLGWTADSKNILFAEFKRTRTALFSMPVDGPARLLYEPARGTIGAADINRGATHIALTQEAPDTPPEVFTIPLAARAPVQVSRANSDLTFPTIGKTEVIRWKSKDGLDVEGLLTYPANYEKGKKYPLILNIHGGPAGVFTEVFVGRGSIYPIAAFAERGYAVLRPNPRGSSGYGKTFRHANYNDWGGRDYEDDQAGVDKVIEMGIADPDKLAVMGWSYGGFMTSWTITQTNRFKAAVIGAGVTNLWSFTGTADIPGFLPDYFGGEPWDVFDTWVKHSPISHIKNVKTPTLILHGEADDRVPVSQGYEYYNALKRQGVLTKMVVYPRTPHGPREPKFVMDIMQRHIDWVDTYVR
jgi:dipeptidyl aminopeptidase/acylaminoacyl peptidase